MTVWQLVARFIFESGNLVAQYFFLVIYASLRLKTSLQKWSEDILLNTSTHTCLILLTYLVSLLLYFSRWLGWRQRSPRRWKGTLWPTSSDSNACHTLIASLYILVDGLVYDSEAPPPMRLTPGLRGSRAGLWVPGTALCSWRTPPLVMRSGPRYLTPESKCLAVGGDW